MRTLHQTIEAIRQVQTRKGRTAFGRYAIEGTRHIERVLRAKLPLQQVLVAASYWAAPDPRIQAVRAQLEAAQISVTIAPDDAVMRLVGGRKLGAIIGLTPLPAPPAFATLIAQRPNPLLLVLVNVVEPGNVGAMIRTAHGLNVAACVVVGSSDPFHPKAVRTAMGSLFKMPIIAFNDGATAAAQLRAAGVTLYASVAGEGQLLPHVTFVPGPKAILMGGEFYGLSADLVARCDDALTIPMADGIDSLSVSAAAAILLYAANDLT